MPYLGNIPATQFAELKYQDFTGGTGTSFTLNDPVGTAQELEVFVNNVRQEPGVAYTVSGTTLTMTGSIVATDDFYVVFQGKSTGTATHPAGQALTATDGTFTGDLTVDTNTLHVDAANNRVGVGTASPSKTLHVSSNAFTYPARITQTGGTTVGLEFTNTGSGANPPVVGSKSDDIFFETSNSERARILSSGGITFNGDTAAANALDDYEEGSFTPTFGGSTGNQTVTYSTQLGTYVKVGKLVFVNISVIASGTPVGGSGDLLVKGLPFTGKSGVQQAGSIAFANNISFGSSGTQGYCNIEGGASQLQINSQELSGTSSMARVPANGIANADPRIVCTICYETA